MIKCVCVRGGGGRHRYKKASVTESQYLLILCSGYTSWFQESCFWTPSNTEMLSLLFFAGLCATCLAKPALVHYSYSLAVGGGSGTSFSSEGEGRITAVRVWEINNAYITGIQLRYDYIWSKRLGRVVGNAHELNLFDGESIVQISGKYHSNYIYQVVFVTSRGRSLIVGQPLQKSFNFYPAHSDAELRLLSGRFNGNGITSLGAHWGVIYMDQGNSTNSTDSST
ncbi:zymogen granule membrane protein 16-like [Trachinotus anak]|uniref:zymogen granule membrane protein 16-like n=1 Tax=Trachinotus anak TaxID=443729 RepID=UPI0039F189D4